MFRVGESTPLRPNSAAGARPVSSGHHIRPASAAGSPGKLKRSNCFLRALGKQTAAPDPEGRRISANGTQSHHNPGGFMPNGPSRPRPLILDASSSVDSGPSGMLFPAHPDNSRLPKIARPQGSHSQETEDPERKVFRFEGRHRDALMHSPMTVHQLHDRDVYSLNRAADRLHISDQPRDSCGGLSRASSGPYNNQALNFVAGSSYDPPVLCATQDTTISEAAGRRYYTDYDEIECLGSGCFGLVTLCKDRNSGEHVAVKRIGPLASHRDTKQHIKEATILTCVRGRSPHVVQLLCSFIDGHPEAPRDAPGHAYGYLVMQFCPYGTLKQALDWRRANGAKWSEQEVITFIVEIAEALHTLHAHHIAHVDVKPANILIDTDMRYVLSDFGLAHFIDPRYGRPVSGKVTGPVGRSTEANDEIREEHRAPSYTETVQGRDSHSSNAARNSVTAQLFPVPSEDDDGRLFSAAGAASNNNNNNPAGLVSFLSQMRSDSVAYSLNTLASQDVGDGHYVSPDMLNQKRDFFAGDVFSLGVSVFEMMAGVEAPANGPLHTELRSGDRQAILQRYPHLSSGAFSDQLLDLLFRMLCPAPEYALRAFDILIHPSVTAGCMDAMRRAVESVTSPLRNAVWRPLPRVPLTHLPPPPAHCRVSKRSLSTMEDLLHSPPMALRSSGWPRSLSPSQLSATVGGRDNEAPAAASIGIEHLRACAVTNDLERTPPLHACSSRDDDHTPIPGGDHSPEINPTAQQQRPLFVWSVMSNPAFIRARYDAAQALVAETLLRTQIPLRQDVAAQREPL